jgi:hypothetical protein
MSNEQPDLAAEKATRKRQLCWAVVWFVIFLGIVTLIFLKDYFNKGTPDEAKYAEMQRISRVMRLISPNKFLVRTTQRIGLWSRYSNRWIFLQDELLQSGYLTNASFAASLNDTNTGPAISRLINATMQTNALMKVGISENDLSVICRTKDVPYFRALFLAASNSSPASVRQ